jgi:hypothetical protein
VIGEDAFRRIIVALDNAGIPYMLTGSFAGSFHGVPRASNDIDIVIAPGADGLRKLDVLLPRDEYYFDLESAEDAMARRSQFNIIELTTGWKIDLIVRKSRPYSEVEFERRTPVQIHDLRVVVASAEDVILSKLEWSKLGDSRRQLEDAAGILATRWPDLDRGYLERWVRDLDLLVQWEAARRIAEDS